MRTLWLFWLPLIFIPDRGLLRETQFGVLQPSDFLIWVYILLLLMARGKRQRPLHIDQVKPLLGSFVVWAMMATLMINVRYDYGSDYYQTYFGMLKLGKLGLYGVAGVLTATALARDGKRHRYDCALLAAGCIVGLALFTLPHGQGLARMSQTLTSYKATNAASAMSAILLCYLAGRSISPLTRRGEARYTWCGVILLGLGMLVSHGRGGWVAALAGLTYLARRRGFGKGFLIGIITLGALVVPTYFLSHEFRDQANKLVILTTSPAATRDEATWRPDDGGRLWCWRHEAAKFPNAPVLGTGFFHRGGPSTLWTIGSHNFFLQMFLETGIVGGSLVLLIFLRMWRHATSQKANGSTDADAVKAALVAAFVAGLSGEYFYGGRVLFTLFLAYAPAGAIVAPHSRKARYASPRAPGDHGPLVGILGKQTGAPALGSG